VVEAAEVGPGWGRERWVPFSDSIMGSVRADWKPRIAEVQRHRQCPPVPCTFLSPGSPGHCGPALGRDGVVSSQDSGGTMSLRRQP
jgi:hypothetical protein